MIRGSRPKATRPRFVSVVPVGKRVWSTERNPVDVGKRQREQCRAQREKRPLDNLRAGQGNQNHRRSPVGRHRTGAMPALGCEPARHSQKITRCLSAACFACLAPGTTCIHGRETRTTDRANCGEASNRGDARAEVNQRVTAKDHTVFVWPWDNL